MESHYALRMSIRLFRLGKDSSTQSLKTTIGRIIMTEGHYNLLIYLYISIYIYLEVVKIAQGCTAKMPVYANASNVSITAFQF